MTIDKPSKSHAPALRALWKEAFGDSEEYLDAFGRTAFSAERCRCVLIGDTPAAALYWFDCSYSGGRIAYLYAVATDGAHRGRGLCSALMEDTHRHLAARGYAGAVLVPGTAALFAFYQKFGYGVCSRIRVFSCQAAEHGAALRQIGTDEYAALRRRLLPKGGVIQESENLEFLRTHAVLYAGEGCVLAARCENGILYAAEMLGDTAAAPAIVRALRCTEGRFRAPGGDLPFAMYRTLGGEAPPPTYFGLAFD